MIPIIDFRHYDDSHPASIASLAEQVASALTSEGFMGIQKGGGAKAPWLREATL